jgi:peptidoglycan hydrolase CwlO-like protein
VPILSRLLAKGWVDAVYYSPAFDPTNPMLKTHKRAMSDIKSAHQRVKKAQEECDKLKEKLKQAQAKLATEKRRLNASEQALES